MTRPRQLPPIKDMMREYSNLKHNARYGSLTIYNCVGTISCTRGLFHTHSLQSFALNAQVKDVHTPQSLLYIHLGMDGSQ